MAADLKKQVQELKTNQQLSTPPKVVQKRKQSSYEVVGRLREAEKICTEAVETITIVWGELIEDETVEKLAEQARQVELHVLVVKTTIKKLPTKEKIAKGAELKKLQDKVRTLHEQETRHNQETAEKQAEA